MKNLNALVMDCKTALDNLDIEYGFIQSVTINTRAKKRWGMCTKEGGEYIKLKFLPSCSKTMWKKSM